ncbi:MAG: hypothetical protein PHR35_09905 [Kiritimatiellae bacterium]|nr:hypothetical protein [Kiritimatiellia bacterium]
MDKDDVVATVALKALEKEMRLRRTVTEPAYAYYCRGGIVGVISDILAMGWVVWMLIEDNIPAWGRILFGLAIIGLLESARQRKRFNALVELMEIEKNKIEAKHRND